MTWEKSLISKIIPGLFITLTGWLPKCDELRQELISSYLLQKRRREELHQDIKKGKGHPTLPVLQGFDQPGPQEKTCYGCGEKGHFKGDPDCRAGPNDIWSGAPEGFKTRVKNGGRGRPNKGKGRGKARVRFGNRQRSLKKPSDDSKIPYKFFNSGNGYCKWGDNCRHSHEGKKGGKRKSALVLSKKEKKKAKKEVAAMVVKDLKSAHGGKKKKEVTFEDKDDTSLYNLMRGKSSLMIQRLDDEDSEDLSQGGW